MLKIFKNLNSHTSVMSSRQKKHITGISGNVDEPDININPLSALSPNSLKDLFASAFGENND